ncbi:SDR family NAD(P)-dependent oxidoreductase [Plastoroseomonas arctica]|nr:SDR family NAD(P)-dependent oxidoreductase [Plastoroseomonas arctica]
MVPRSLVISGASRGLGAALALRFAAPGVTLRLVARGARALTAVAGCCRARGAAVDCATIDVRDAAALGAQLAAWDAAVPIDTIVANAGISRGRTPEGGREGHDAAAEQVAVNLLGAMNLIEPLLDAPGLRRVAVIGSLAGFVGLPDTPGYSASKAGLIAYGEALRVALAPRVAVTVVAPGFFESAMSARFLGAKPGMLSLEAAAVRVERAIRSGDPRCAFPPGLALGVRLLPLLPARLSDWILRRERFRIAPE